MAKDVGNEEKVVAKRAPKAKPAPVDGEGSVKGFQPVAWVKHAWEVSEQFLREVRTELKKVTWPSRNETLASTGVVLIIVFLVAIYLGGVDMALSKIIGAILR